MQTNQYNSQNYYYHQQSSQAPAQPRSNGGTWIIIGVLTGTILLSAIVALVLIFIINGANKNPAYPKTAAVTGGPTQAATVPPAANVVTTPAFSTPVPVTSPVIGGTVTASAAGYELPVSPLAIRLTLNQADDQQITEGLKKFGFKNGRYEMYKIDLNQNISAGGSVRNFYYVELQKLGWKYSEEHSGATDSVDIYEKGNFATFVTPFIVGYDLSDSKYSYAGVESGDGIILVMTGEYDGLNPTLTGSSQNTNPTSKPASK